MLDRLRTDPALRYSTGEEIMADAREAFHAAKAIMGDWFGRLPQSDCAIEEVPAFLAPDSPSAYYFPPAGDGSRGGTYYVNTHAPEDKARYETASIAFHEAIPGHHLQIAIATELTDVPSFRRFSLANTAYVEGWGLYSERLADDMGLYRNDMERIGMLAADSIRACRLVVDTGLHALGWTRQQAIDFMAANTPVSVEEVTVEIDRYIGMPGQALAYKLGQREILRLRESARAQLGDRFDIRGFHDAVLTSGAVRLPILAELVGAWVDSRTVVCILVGPRPGRRPDGPQTGGSRLQGVETRYGHVNVPGPAAHVCREGFNLEIARDRRPVVLQDPTVLPLSSCRGRRGFTTPAALRSRRSTSTDDSVQVEARGLVGRVLPPSPPHRTTTSRQREVNANGGRDGYRAVGAQTRPSSGPGGLRSPTRGPSRVAWVIARLTELWSPKQIADQLPIELQT